MSEGDSGDNPQNLESMSPDELRNLLSNLSRVKSILIGIKDRGNEWTEDQKTEYGRTHAQIQAAKDALKKAKRPRVVKNPIFIDDEGEIHSSKKDNS